MPYALNHYRAQDQYTDAGTIRGDGIGVNIYVVNAPVYYEIAPETAQHRAPSFEPEVFLTPGRYFFGRVLSAIRFRNGIPSMIALVTAEVLKEYEA